MNAQGTVHEYGDDVNTDVIIPARYLNTASHKELAAHCMEDIDKDFVTRVQPGDIIVGDPDGMVVIHKEDAAYQIEDSIKKRESEIKKLERYHAGNFGREEYLALYESLLAKIGVTYID